MSDETLWNDYRITAYVLGELSTTENAAFEEEMRTDPALAAAVEETRVVTGKLVQLFAEENTPPLDATRREAIIAHESRVNSPSVASQSASGWNRRHVFQAAVVASILFLLASLTIPKFRPAPVDYEVAMQSPSLAPESRSEGADSSNLTASIPSESKSSESKSSESMLSKPLSSMKEVDVSGGQGESLGAQVSAPMIVMEEHDSAPLSPDAPAAETAPAAPALADPAPADPAPADPASASRIAEFRKADATDSLFRNAKKEVAPMAKDLSQSMRGDLFDASAGAPEPLIASSREPSSDYRELNIDDQVRVRPTIGNPIVESPIGIEAKSTPEGTGPGSPGDQFDTIDDNPFMRVSEAPLSTFSVDVDTASYSKVRDFLMRANQLPRRDAVRIEEMINYFDYDYAPPAESDEHPFAARAVMSECPWNPDHRIARIAIKGKEMSQKERPRCNLVFLLDTSGSMNEPNKLPLVQEGMKMLLEKLNPKDRVAITVYAGSAGLVLDSTKVKNAIEIRRALTQLSAGGSTNGGAGIALAYQVARDNFLSDGVNRVLLCTDGDFNVGTTGTDALVRMVEKEAKGGVYLSVLGFGMGNHNDAMLEQISGRGNGNYAFIDTEKEAKKVLVEQTNATLVTIAKDVKLQLEFNPAHISSYRLIGYENRVLAKEDFNDDKKDAGEIGAGHSVTALYEIVPAGKEADALRPKVDPLRFQKEIALTEEAKMGPSILIKLRYKLPDSDVSTLVEFPVQDEGKSFDAADRQTQFAAAVAGFGMQLRRSEYKGSWTLSDVIRVATQSKGEDENGLRGEFIEMAKKAKSLMGEGR